MHSFALALQFLTRLPVPFNLDANDQQLGRSVLFYPVVGLLIGLLLIISSIGLSGVHSFLQAALILTFWILLSGGLHLDGLADCADAWVGGLGDRQRTLDIMKDPAAGPAAVVFLVLIILLKWTALQIVLTSHQWQALLVAPLLGRTILLVLMLTSPYVRTQGLGEKLIRYLPAVPARQIIAVVLAGCILLSGLLPVISVVLLITGIHYIALQRLGGFTGDVYGAAVELTEVVVLIGFAVHE